MPGFKTIYSSVLYHNVTAPAIKTTKNLAAKAINRLKRRRAANAYLKDRKTRPLKLKPSSAVNPARKASVQMKTRGTTANNPKLWSKGTLAGLKRRKAAATKARGLSRPVRTHNGPKVSAAAQTASKPSTPAPKPSPAKVALVRSHPRGSVAATVHTSKTAGQLRRKLGNQAVKAVTKSITIPKSDKNARHERAKDIWALRKAMGQKVLADRVKYEKNKRLKEAASYVAKSRKKP